MKRKSIRRSTTFTNPSLQTTAGLLSLPMELLQMICDKIEQDDIYNIRSVCQQLNVAVAPRFFSRIIIDVGGGRLPLFKLNRTLAVMCDNESLTASFTKTLEIRSLSVTPGRIAMAIRHLRKVSNVSWNLGRNETDQGVSEILASILSLPNLDSFSVTFSRNVQAHLAMDKLTNLRRLSISNNFASNTLRPFISDIMPMVIANNPDLTHLCVHDAAWKVSWMVPEDLREILGEITESSGPPLQLQHLRLSSCATRLDLVTLRHLKCLTSFDLHRGRYGSDSFNVWDTLFSEGHLEILKLRSLADDENLAKRFFRDILPNHADTLQTLCLKPEYEGPWSLGSGTLDSVLQCHRLVQLAFSIEFDLSTTSEENWEKGIEIHPVVFMFNQLAHLPHLFELEFMSALSQKPINFIGRSYADLVNKATRKAIRQFLPDYGVHPHVVTSAGLDYKLGRKEEAGKSYLRYIPCGAE